MKKITYLFLLQLILMGFTNISYAQYAQIINVQNRKTTSLNGKWKYIIDPYQTGYYDYRYKPYDQAKDSKDIKSAFFNDAKSSGKSDLVEYNFDQSGSLIVPKAWNTQDDKLFYYEGTIWYRKKFSYTKSDSSNRVFLYFGAVNYKAEVYLNGTKLGTHIGGFTPFDFEITNLMTDSVNTLIVKVDDTRKREAVPTINTDWFNYGGITRDVMLIEEPNTFLRDYMIQLKKGNASEISGFVQLDGAQAEQAVTISIPELKIKQVVKTNQKGFANIHFNVRNVEYWSPDAPRLYDVYIDAGSGIPLKDQIGFRTIETRGKDILLNGKPVFLRGIAIHEENGIRGDRAYSVEDAKLLLGWAKELGCNFVRLAHYPHNENMIRTAEKMGIMVWEENPVYWTILWNNKNTYENAKKQLTDVITRDRNRANVIIWSMANETPISPERTEFLANLAKWARELDNTRLISAAMEKHADPQYPDRQIVEDPFADYVDVVGFNEYVGWYDGLPEKCNRVSWEINYNKPVVISEFGGGALQGFHGSKDVRWTEEFQANLYKQTLKMIKTIPNLSGVTPWLLADFRSPKRVLPFIQDGWNRKGLVSQTGNKKEAFYVLQGFYQEIEKKGEK